MVRLYIFSFIYDQPTDSYTSSFPAHILTNYDALVPFDQLIVKCAAVLGRRFLRSSLIYLMNTSERNVSMSIQRLFERNIFMCAGGNFSKGNIFYQKQVQTSGLEEIECICKHLHVSGKFR